jgi:hypothetical protein
MMNRVSDGSKFFFNVHTGRYVWTRTEDVVKDFSLLTKDEIQVHNDLVLLLLLLLLLLCLRLLLLFFFFFFR